MAQACDYVVLDPIVDPVSGEVISNPGIVQDDELKDRLDSIASLTIYKRTDAVSYVSIEWSEYGRAVVGAWYK